MGLREDIMATLKPLFNGERVIWANPNAPRPPLPYNVLRLASRRMVGRDHLEDGVDEEGNLRITGNREYTLSVERHGENSVLVMEVLTDKIRTPTAMARFAEKGIAVFDSEAVMDIAKLLGEADIEPRAGVDLMIRARSVTLDNVGIIETLIVTGKDDGKNSPTYAATIDVKGK